MKKAINEYQRRFKILTILTLILFVILFVYLFNIQIVKNNYFKEQYYSLSENIVEGSTSPRGRIYDRFGRLIVDNTPVRTIYYKKQNKITTKEEIDLAYNLSDLLEIDYSKITDDIKKTFWMKINQKKASEKISDKEMIDLRYRKITGTDIEKLKKDRITEEELSELTDRDLETSYIYYLMNKGYSYSEKIIKDKDVTDSEYAIISSNLDNLKGIGTRLDWERYYPYGTVFKSVLGSVSSSDKGIPEDLKDYYLSKGYSLNDRVGTLAIPSRAQT